MKTFRQYLDSKRKTLVTETTVPEHLQHIPENWDHHSNLSEDTLDKIHKATNGKTFTHFPLDTSHHDIDPDVVEHLSKHNYDIKDYAKGIASIKKQVGDPSNGIPMREKIVNEKIGSVLDKTGASDDVKKAFVNDPVRSSYKASTTSGLHVVISHSPLAIAGMSTGTHWKKQSCMNMEGGGYQHKLRDDSENGTHVAFLVHHDDKEAFAHGTPANPIARIAIKPYHETHNDHDSDTIFRPESEQYGNGSTHFANAVSRWASENYPAKIATEYHKNSNVYDDSGNNTYKALDKKSVENSLNIGKDIVRNGGGLDKDIIDHAISHVSEKFNPSKDASFPENKNGRKVAIAAITSVGNLNTQHVAKLHRLAVDGGTGTHDLAVAHGDKFSTNAIRQYHESYYGHTPNKMLMNPKLPPDIFDKVEPSQYHFAHTSHIKDKHIDKAVNDVLTDPYSSTGVLTKFSDRLTKAHIDALVNIPHGDKGSDLAAPNVFRAHTVIMNSPHFRQDHHDKILSAAVTSGDEHGNRIADIMKNSKFASLGDVEKHLSVPGDYKRKSRAIAGLSENKNAVDSHVAIKNAMVESAHTNPVKDPSARASIGIPGFGVEIPENISKHMTDDDYKKMSHSGRWYRFKNAEHSGKHLQAIEDNVIEADHKVSEHEDAANDKHGYDGNWDDETQEHHDKLDYELMRHHANMGEHLDNHIDDHVENSENDGIKNMDEHDRVRRHIDTMTSDLRTISYRDYSHEHNIAPQDKKLTRLKDSQDRIDEYGDDHWD